MACTSNVTVFGRPRKRPQHPRPPASRKYAPQPSSENPVRARRRLWSRRSGASYPRQAGHRVRPDCSRQSHREQRPRWSARRCTAAQAPRGPRRQGPIYGQRRRIQGVASRQGATRLRPPHPAALLPRPICTARTLSRHGRSPSIARPNATALPMAQQSDGTEARNQPNPRPPRLRRALPGTRSGRIPVAICSSRPDTFAM